MQGLKKVCCVYLEYAVKKKKTWHVMSYIYTLGKFSMYTIYSMPGMSTLSWGIYESCMDKDPL
jgi:TRAP-type mannitol/chloroaromatic compound transport system permease small subunit